MLANFKKIYLIIFFLFIQIGNVSSNNWLDSAATASQQQDYFSEIEYYKSWLKNNTNPVDSLSIEVMLKLAYAYRLTNNMKMCLKAVGIARDYSQKIDNEFLYLKSTISLAEYNRVLTKLQSSLEILNDMDKRSLQKYPDLLARYYHRKAAVFNQFENPYLDSYFDSTLENSLLSLNVSKAIAFNDALGTSYNEIAFAYERKEMFEEAIPYYDSAAYYLKNESFINYINSKANGARLQYFLGNFQASIDSSNNVLTLLENHDLPNLKYPLYFYIGKSYLKLGDTLKAYENKNYRLQYFIDYLEGVKQKEIFQLSVEYEVLDKNKTIEINKLELKKESQKKILLSILLLMTLLILILIILIYIKLNRANKKLKQLLHENQFLLGESNHRIKNNLQLIISLIAIDQNKLELNDNKEISKLSDISSKIESIAYLHHKLYKNKDKSIVQLNEYIKEILTNLEVYLLRRNIVLDYNANDIEIDVDNCMYFGLLTTELIINSLKHAFENNENGLIIINIQKEGKKIIFTYQDNGKGTEEYDNIVLVNIMSEQLNGDITIENRNGFYYQLIINYQ